MMEILSCEEYNDVLSWIPSGMAFIIYKKKKFLADVLPKYFKQSKFTSFTRKLNRWGFTRIARGPGTGSYFHKLFQRDHPYLCLRMKCQHILSSKQSDENSKLHHDNSQRMLTQNAVQASMTAGPPSLDSMSVPYLPFGMHLPTMPIQGASNLVVNLQRKLQMEQILKQRIHLQKIQNESIQRAIASPFDVNYTQHHLREESLHALANQKRNDLLFMQQMMAQSEASSLSAKPILEAIENSILKISNPVIDPIFMYPGLSSQQILNPN
jgi:hypothetical protein